MKTKPFFLLFVGTLVLGLAAVAATNYAIDVRGVFRMSTKSFQAGITNYVQHLTRSATGLVKPAVSDRAIKYELAQQASGDCYVFGSSHEMTLNLQRVPSLAAHCRSVVNLAVSAGGYEDALAMLGVLVDKEPKDKLVIFGIGPWYLKNRGLLRWHELHEGYAKARARLLGEHTRVVGNDGTLKNLINGEYLTYNINSLLTPGGTAPSTLGPDSLRPATAHTEGSFQPDGSLTYSAEYVEKTFPRGDTTQCTDYMIARPFVYDSAVLELERVLTALTANGTRIALLLSPYHPGIHKCAIDTPAALRETEARVRSIGKRLGIPVWGGYDAALHGMTGEDFYDFMHVDANSLHKLRLEPVPSH